MTTPLPTNFTDATVAAVNHAAAHNATNERVNDVASGTSSALVSASGIATVSNYALAVPLLAGGGEQLLDFTGYDVFTDDDYRGTPGSSLGLPVTVSGAQIIYPTLDARYELNVDVRVNADGADVGKLIGLRISGSDGTTRTWHPLKSDGAGGATANLQAAAFDRTFLGDDPPPFLRIRVDPAFLTVDATIYLAYVGIYGPVSPS